MGLRAKRNEVPGEVIGNISPTAPPPPKPRCGTLAAVVGIVVAAVVTVYSGFNYAAGAAAGDAARQYFYAAANGQLDYKDLVTGSLRRAAGALLIGVPWDPKYSHNSLGYNLSHPPGFTKDYTYDYRSTAGAAAAAYVAQGTSDWLDEGAEAGAQAATRAASPWYVNAGRQALVGAASSVTSQVVQGHFSWRQVVASSVGAGLSGGASSAGNSIMEKADATSWLKTDLGAFGNQLASSITGGWASNAIALHDADKTRASLGRLFTLSLSSVLSGNYVQAQQAKAQATADQQAALAAMAAEDQGYAEQNQLLKAREGGNGLGNALGANTPTSTSSPQLTDQQVAVLRQLMGLPAEDAPPVLLAAADGFTMGRWPASGSPTPSVLPRADQVTLTGADGAASADSPTMPIAEDEGLQPTAGSDFKFGADLARQWVIDPDSIPNLGLRNLSPTETDPSSTSKELLEAAALTRNQSMLTAVNAKLARAERQAALSVAVRQPTGTLAPVASNEFMLGDPMGSGAVEIMEVAADGAAPRRKESSRATTISKVSGPLANNKGSRVRDYSYDEGVGVVSIAAKWEQTPYASAQSKFSGERASLDGGADCSGSTYKIFEQAGLSYRYQSSSKFSAAVADGSIPFRRLDKNEPPQPGDVIKFNGHLAIYAGTDAKNQAMM